MSVLRSLLPSLRTTQLLQCFFYQGVSHSFHTLAQPNALASNLQNKLLTSPSICITQTCGLKVKGQLRRRCKACFYVMREQRLYVLCKKHPRHKQMSMVKDEKNTWILSHATQSKVRPW